MTSVAILYLYSDRTGKKIVHYFLNTQRSFMRYSANTLSCKLNCFMLYAVVFHTTSSKDSLFLLEVVRKNTASVETAF